MTEDNSNIGPVHQNLQENDNEITSLIESVKKLSILINDRDTEVVCDSGSECPIITYEVAKKLGFKKDKSLSNSEASAKAHITDKTVSGIVKQILHRRISISLHQLMEIVKPEIGLKIIDLIANPDISRRNRTPSKAKRKKRFLNNTASDSSSSSSSEYGSISE
ncbi:9103_t:CDS:1 [Cetraspora pellucida]|uniref:9103_t:CDS:1 n=1 Tax=Cetraspora pellucida TaxID=1433469 RepID=A0ACA9JVR4_9GLOM|nr:9103_t:CDS:1 [Cetraspora pellucida]